MGRARTLTSVWSGSNRSQRKRTGMILERFYDDNLAEASYLVGCERTKNAAVIDPTIDIGIYLEAAERRKLRITHVLETHVHADFLSGGASLAKETGAELCLSAEGDPKWGYDFASIKSARKLRDGDEISLGDVNIRVLHTPGHTPEHLTYLVSDAARGSGPVGALTGDFIFVGDVGRPDLLEKAVGVGGTMRDSAAALYASIRKFVAEQPDHLQIWPGHGAGSACGKALGAMPSSTLGYEKLFNWALRAKSEDAFIAEVLKDQTPPPRYFAEMKKRNRLAEPVAFGANLDHLVDTSGGGTTVDTRTADVFAAGHIPRSINIPFNKSFLTWAGALIDPDKPLFLIADDESRVRVIGAELSKIGFGKVSGWLSSRAAASYGESGLMPGTIPQISVKALHEMGDNAPVVIDVRAPYEWSEGHIPGAIHIPLAELPSRVAELAAAGTPIAVHCRGGGRSSIAASILRSHGVASVKNVTEGYDGWAAAGLPVTRDEAK